MRFFTWSFFIFCFHFFSCLTFGQKPSFVFHHLSINDGLSENTVRCIVEDKRGFMWFGSEDGINKYDGYKFTVYKNDPRDKYSLSSSISRCFYNDSKGNLWVGTRHGLNLYDHKQDKFYNYNSEDYPALKSLTGHIEALTEDNAGVLWIVGGSEGLFKVSSLQQAPQNFSFSSTENTPLNAPLLSCLIADQQGDFWIGTNDGLLKFDTRKNKFTDLRSVYGKGYHIRTMYTDEQGNLWLLTTDGLKYIDVLTRKIKEYRHDPGKKFSLNGNNVLQMVPKEGKFLVAIDGDGIDLFDPETERFYHYTVENGSQLSSNNITCLYKDSKETVWAGTFMNGINFSNITTNFFVYKKNNPSNPQYIKEGVVTCFLKDKSGNLWVSTDGGGFFFKKKGMESFIQYTSSDKKPVIKNDAVIGMIEDTDGIWMTTYGGGISRFNYPNDFTIYRHDVQDTTSVASDKLLAICEYRNEIWVSTHGFGISVLNKKSRKFRHYHHTASNPHSIPSDWVHRIYQDSKGVLWLATFNGVAKYLPESDSFKNYYFNSNDNTIAKNFVYEIFEDSRDNFWLGTYGGGLILFDRDQEKFNVYNTEDGLAHNSVKTIIEDDARNLWLASNNHISKFNIDTRKAVPYTINDGLPPCSFFHHSKYKDEEGKIYLGSNEGYLVIDPELSVEETSFPRVVLTNLKIFNVPVQPGKSSLLKTHINEARQIVLPYFQNSLTFEFAALNFNIPKRNLYSYKLEGFEEEWSLSGKNRLAIYTNLNPGTYIFKVRASNNGKIWSEEATGFEVIITPPFWLTWWFKMLMGTTVLMIPLVFFFIRTKNIRKNNRWLKDQVSERTRDLQDANLVLAEQNQKMLSQSEKIMQQQKELLDKKYALEKNNEELAEWNEFQNRLIGVLGHDLRGPLQHFSLLLKYQTEDSSEWVNAKLKETAASLSLLATDLLGWITLQSRKGEVQPTHFTWKEVLEKAIKEVEPARAEKQVVFRIKNTSEQLIEGVFPIALSSLRNILYNALRFSPKEGVVEIEPGLLKEGYAGIRITDYGQGFEADQVNKLIQGDAFKGMKEASLKEGAGLGIAICYDMIRRTGGWIEAASLPGSGATFYIFIPIAEPKKEEVILPKKEEEQPVLMNGKLELLKGKKILLVDDDDELRWPVVKLLSNYVEVQEVRNAEEALKWLKDHTPDMALLDIRMPGESGLELCKKIKSSPETAHVPCTIISGETGEDVRKEVFEAGADAFLTKPFESVELLLHISSYFENQAKKLRKFLHEGSSIDQLFENPLNKEFLTQLIHLVEENLTSGNLNVDFLAAEMGLSRASLYRRLKSLTGQTVNDFIRDIRMRKSLSLLKKGNLNISEVAEETGFNSLSYFTTSFKKHFGYNPTELKK